MAPVKELRKVSRDEVAKHNKADDCWIIIDSYVYDLSRFMGLHPGGEGVLLNVAGKDATEEFYGLHRQEVMEKFGPRYIIGQIADEKPKLQLTKPGEFSKVPYAESGFWQGRPSPFYKESHIRFRQALREFYDRELMPDAASMDAMGEAPDLEVYQKMGQMGLLACRLGPGPHLKLVPSLPANVSPDEFDYFHEMIAHEETTRLGIYCYAEGLASGMCIGLPPLLNFGPRWMQDTVVKEILLGNKRICLAITEPTVGSDVANLSTTAVKTPDGKHFIVNGVKKWITNGTFSDYFTTAVRTGGKGMNGISMLLIPRVEGVETKIIKTSGSTSAGTAYVTFENVKVPVENLIGKENKGFPVIMANFNHERWSMVVGATRAARLVTEECFKWANQRMVFGKKLLEQPVIRFKLAEMLAGVESLQGYLETTTYQMTQLSYKDQAIHLAGPLGLLKYQATRMTQRVSDNAVQIFGGRAITRTGMGRVIESFQRSNKFGAILGGAEEIMADLAVRQAMKNFPEARL
ncbi:acyl-CoA dehydrogenase/oxidase [Gaertneriomyces semiglobifer]|nr:acyl-CoA dehydrogenase/oxidase [Gaertneriomyces semiglobifer]